jgi:serine/threonine-protein kinase RsbW
MTQASTPARLVIRRPDLTANVLERVVAALAARADLPLDRLSDAQIASAAAAAAAARHMTDGALYVELDDEPGAVTVRIGPLPAGAAARVVEESAVPGVGAIVERLVDRWSVDRGAAGDERLSLAILDGDRGPVTGGDGRA